MSVGTNLRTVAELAQLCGAEVEGDGGLQVAGPASLGEAGPTDVSFLAQPKYAAQLDTTRAGAVLVGRDVEVSRTDLALLRCADPERAFTDVILAFAPPIPEVPVGASPDAFVHPSATVAEGARIAPLATIGEHAVVAANATIHSGVHVGAYARVGAETTLYPGVVLYPHVVVGERCLIHANTVVGSDGFGFRPEKTGWVKNPQVGNVEVGDDVEMGSNVSIDCGRFGPTRIGQGTKIDNQVHVAHNVQVGAGTLLLAQVGVAGSSSIGKGVIIAGQAGVAGHISIGDGARVLGGAGITKDVPAGEEWFGYPAAPRRDKMRELVGAARAGTDIRALKLEIADLRRAIEELRGEPQGE